MTENTGRRPEDVLKGPAHGRKVSLGCFGQAQASGQPFEQGMADVTLQAAYTMTDCRLRQVQLLGSGGKILIPRRSLESLKCQ